jgi:GxxExxY protein
METNDSFGAKRNSTVALVEKELNYMIVGAFFTVYNTLGFGFLESIYIRSLELLLKKQQLLVDREHPIDVYFHGEIVGQHRVDLLVERRIVVEVKSTERLSDVPKRQLRNYVTALDLKLGILLHFGPRAEYYRVFGRRTSDETQQHRTRIYRMETNSVSSLTNSVS